MAKRHFKRTFVGNINNFQGGTNFTIDLEDVSIVVPAGATVEYARAIINFVRAWGSNNSNSEMVLQMAVNQNTLIQIQKGSGSWNTVRTYTSPGDAINLITTSALVNSGGGGQVECVLHVPDDISSYITGTDSYGIRITGLDVNTATQSNQKYVVQALIEVEFSIDDVAGSTELQTVDDNIDSILTDTSDMQPRVAAIEIDTDEIQGKLPTNEIMGSSTKADKDDEIDDIKTEVDKLFDADMGSPSGLTNGSFADRIMNKDGSQTYDESTDSLEAIRDRGDNAWAGTGATKEEIAQAVWEESIDGSHSGDEAGKVLYDVEQNVDDIKTETDEIPSIQTDLDNIEADTQNIQNRLPTTLTVSGNMRSSIEEKNAGVGLSSAEQTDVRSEADDALDFYDPPTRAEATADKDEIISEIDDNETKIDAIQTDVTSIESKVDIIDDNVDDIHAKTEAGTPSPTIPDKLDDIEDDTQDIQSKIGTPSGGDPTLFDEHDTTQSKVDAVQSSVDQIQNSTKTVVDVPKMAFRPESGSKTYRIHVLNYEIGGPGMEDFDSDPSIRIDYVSGGAIVAPTTMTKPGGTTGEYYYDWVVPPGQALGNAIVRVDASDNGSPVTFIRDCEIADEQTDEIQEILDDVNAIYDKTDAGTVSPTIPAQLDDIETKVDSAITAIMKVQDAPAVIRLEAPDIMNRPVFRGKLITEDGDPLPVGATEIEVNVSSLLQPAGFIRIDDEYIYYDGIEDNVLKNCLRGRLGSTPAEHDHWSDVYATYLHKFTLQVFPIEETNDGYMFSSAELFMYGGEEFSDLEYNEDLVHWAGGLYWLDIPITPLFASEEKMVIIYYTLNGFTRRIAKIVWLQDEPYSLEDSAESGGIGIGIGDYILDQDGWYDELGILHEWEDEYGGPVMDTAGNRLDDVIISAFPVDDESGETLWQPTPPMQTITTPLGLWNAALDAGTYTFTFVKDGKKFLEVNRTIGE